MSHWKTYGLAERRGDEAMASAAMRACYAVLNEMKQRGLHVDPPMAQLYDQLAKLLGP